jgi:hypothetical protein
MALDRRKASFSEPRGGSYLYSSVARRHQRGFLGYPHHFRGRDEVSFSDASYGPHTTLRGKHLTNRAKSVIRVRSELGPCTRLVGHPDKPSGLSAAEHRRSYRSPLAQGRFPAYLLPDRSLDRAYHPPLRSGSSMVIGSVRPMIGRGPIDL